MASAVWWASSLISLATTPNPFPASPARVVSMVALSASRLVCSELLVMVSVIFYFNGLLVFAKKSDEDQIKLAIIW